LFTLPRILIVLAYHVFSFSYNASQTCHVSDSSERRLGDHELPLQIMDLVRERGQLDKFRIEFRSVPVAAATESSSAAVSAAAPAASLAHAGGLAIVHEHENHDASVPSPSSSSSSNSSSSSAVAASPSSILIPADAPSSGPSSALTATVMPRGGLMRQLSNKRHSVPVVRFPPPSPSPLSSMTFSSFAPASSFALLPPSSFLQRHRSESGALVRWRQQWSPIRSDSSFSPKK
jgi:hypothetical protein